MYSFKSCCLRCCFLIYNYLISSFDLQIDPFCCAKCKAGEVFGILILAKFWGHTVSKACFIEICFDIANTQFPLQDLYWCLCARMAFTIFQPSIAVETGYNMNMPSALITRNSVQNSKPFCI